MSNLINSGRNFIRNDPQTEIGFRYRSVGIEERNLLASSYYGDPLVGTEPLNIMLSETFSLDIETMRIVENGILKGFIYDISPVGSEYFVDADIASNSISRATLDHKSVQVLSGPSYAIRFDGQTDSDLSFLFPLLIPLGDYLTVRNSLVDMVSVSIDSRSTSQIFYEPYITVDFEVVSVEPITYRNALTGVTHTMLRLLVKVVSDVSVVFTYWSGQPLEWIQLYDVPVDGTYDITISLNWSGEGTFLVGGSLPVLNDRWLATQSDMLQLVDALDDLTNTVLDLSSVVEKLGQSQGLIDTFFNILITQDGSFLDSISSYDIIKGVGDIIDIVWKAVDSVAALDPMVKFIGTAAVEVVTGLLDMIANDIKGTDTNHSYNAVCTDLVRRYSNIRTKMLYDLPYELDIDNMFNSMYGETQLGYTKLSQYICTVEVYCSEVTSGGDIIKQLFRNISDVTLQKWFRTFNYVPLHVGVRLVYSLPSGTSKVVYASQTLRPGEEISIVTALFPSRNYIEVDYYEGEMVDGEWVGGTSETFDDMLSHQGILIKKLGGIQLHSTMERFLRIMIGFVGPYNVAYSNCWHFVNIVIDFVQRGVLPQGLTKEQMEYIFDS
jgi:hypothetical protein